MFRQQEFKPPKVDLLHLDISGTGMLSTGVGHPYLRKGIMTGRPTRTLIQFLYQIACPHEKGDECWTKTPMWVSVTKRFDLLLNTLRAMEQQALEIHSRQELK